MSTLCELDSLVGGAYSSMKSSDIGYCYVLVIVSIVNIVYSEKKLEEQLNTIGY